MGKRQKRPVIFAPTIFPLYKPVGATSFSVVSHFKRNLPEGFGKIGHFGTLDPFAEGLLLIGIAGAQKLNDFVHQLLPKTYRAIGVLGEQRATGDLEGEVIKMKTPDHSSLEISRWQSSAAEMVGEYWQSPPAFSAAKHHGKALYEYARAGEMIEKPAVKRFIHQLIVHSVSTDQNGRLLVEFEATVSSGTYIRSLFEDLAQKCGELGYLEKLQRTSIGPLSSEQALHADHWPLKGQSFAVEEFGLSLSEVLPLDQLVLDDEQVKKYAHGVSMPLAQLSLKKNGASCKEDLYWVVDSTGRLLGLSYAVDQQVLTHFNLSSSL